MFASVSLVLALLALSSRAFVAKLTTTTTTTNTDTDTDSFEVPPAFTMTSTAHLCINDTCDFENLIHEIMIHDSHQKKMKYELSGSLNWMGISTPGDARIYRDEGGTVCFRRTPSDNVPRFTFGYKETVFRNGSVADVYGNDHFDLILEASTRKPIALIQYMSENHRMVREVKHFSQVVQENEFEFPKHVTCEHNETNDSKNAFLDYSGFQHFSKPFFLTQF